tara:strand:- start:290 stop:5101 length:4812 start_codon:yes stop_codon:yes gene_type:complete
MVKRTEPTQEDIFADDYIEHDSSAVSNWANLRKRRDEYEGSSAHINDLQDIAHDNQFAPIADQEISKIANNDDSGFFGTVMNMGKQLGIGAAKGVEETLEFAGVVEDNAFHLPDPTTTAESLVQGIGQFLPLFIPSNMAISAALRASTFFGKTEQLTKAGQMVSAMGAGAISDFASFDPKDPNVANFLLTSGAIAKDSMAGAALKEWLAQDDSDSRLTARTKNATSGLIAGAIVDQVFRAAGGAIRGFRGKNGEVIPDDKVKLDDMDEGNIYADDDYGVAPTENPLWDVDDAPKQQYTSEKTSINQSKPTALVNSKGIKWEKDTVNLDIGGGKHPKTTESLARKGVTNHIYDPFNRTRSQNKAAIRSAGDGQSDTVTISNTLNVIKEPEVRTRILRQAENALKEDGKVYILIHEGDKSALGKETPKGWQNNRKANTYLEEVQEIFPNATRKGNVITASKEGSKSLFDAVRPVVGHQLDTLQKMKTTDPEYIKKLQDQLPSRQAAILDEADKLERDYLTPFERETPERQQQVYDIIERWAKGEAVQDSDMSIIESMNLLKIEDEGDIPNLLQFLSREMDIAKLTKKTIKDGDFDTMSGLQEIYNLDKRSAVKIIQKHKGNVREAIRFVGAARALATGFMKKADESLDLFVKTGDEVHWDEFQKNSGLGYDMLVAGGELSKASSDLLRAHKQTVNRMSNLEEVKFFARENILKEPFEVRKTKAGRFKKLKKQDEMEIEGRFTGGQKRKIKIDKKKKKDLVLSEQKRLRKKFERLSKEIRKLREQNEKDVADLLKKDLEFQELGIKKLQDEKKALLKQIRAKKRKGVPKSAKEAEKQRIETLNKQITELTLMKAKLIKEGIAPERKAKIIKSDHEKKLIADREKLKEELGLIEKKGLTDEEIRELAIEQARREEIVDIENANIMQLKARLSAMRLSGKARTRDAGLELYINGLLSSIKTSEVNFLGNLTAMFTSVIDRMYAGAKSGGEIQFKEATELMWGYLQEIPEFFSIVHKAWKTPLDNNVKQDFIRPENRAISKEAFRQGGSLGKAIDYVGSVVNFPGKLLLTADEVFKTFNYRAEVKALAYRKAVNELGSAGASSGEKHLLRERIDDIMNNIAKHEDITDAAREFAAKNTYTNKLADHVEVDPITGKEKVVQGLGNRLKGILEKDPTGIVRVFIPFFQTPANLLNFAWERTPWLRRWNRTLQDELAGKMGQGAKELAEARVATSRIMWGGMFAAAWSGNFTGAPPLDPNLRKTLEADMGGPHWYSYHGGIQDGWKKYDRFDPLGVIMAANANLAIMMKASVNLHKQYQQGDPSDEIFEKAKEVLEAGIMGTVKLLTDRHYLQGFAELIDIMTGDHKGLSKLRPFGKRLVGAIDPRTSFYSSFRRNLTRGIEPEKLEKLQHTDMESMGDFAKEIGIIFEEALRDVTPGYGTKVAAKNLVGEPVLFPGGNEEIDRTPFQMMGDIGKALFDPNPPVTGSKSPLIRKLAELESTQGQPSTVNKINGMTMTDEEKAFFVDRWTEWNKKLEKLVVSKSFTQLPLGTQRFILELAISGNKERAKKQTLIAYERLLHGTFEFKINELRKRVSEDMPTGFNQFNLMQREQ